MDTRTDVYALGVLLYQLMVGALPFDTTSLRGDALDIQRAIRDADPPTPSEHARKLSARASGDRAARAPAGAAWRDLRGGLDWIILKAIAKEPDRRYATVAALMGACSSSDDASVAGQDAGATPDGANTSDGGPSAEGGAGSVSVDGDGGSSSAGSSGSSSVASLSTAASSAGCAF